MSKYLLFLVLLYSVFNFEMTSNLYLMITPALVHLFGMTGWWWGWRWRWKAKSKVGKRIEETIATCKVRGTKSRGMWFWRKIPRFSGRKQHLDPPAPSVRSSYWCPAESSPFRPRIASIFPYSQPRISVVQNMWSRGNNQKKTISWWCKIKTNWE